MSKIIKSKKNNHQFLNLSGGGGTFLLFNIANKILLLILFINLTACSSDTNKQKLKDINIINHFINDKHMDKKSPTPENIKGRNLLFMRSIRNIDIYSDDFTANLTYTDPSDSLGYKGPDITNNPFYHAVSIQKTLELKSKNKTFNTKLVVAFPKNFIEALQRKNHLKETPSLVVYVTPTSYNITNPLPHLKAYKAKKAKDRYEYTIPIRTGNGKLCTSQPVIVYLGTPLSYASFNTLPQKATFSYKNTSSKNSHNSFPFVQFDAYNGNPLAAFIRLNEDKKSTYTITIHNKENPKGDVSYKRSLKKGALEILGLYYNDVTKVTLQKDSEKPKILFFDTRNYKPLSIDKEMLIKYQEQKSVKLTQATDYQKFFMVSLKYLYNKKQFLYTMFGVDVNGKIRFMYNTTNSQSFLVRFFKKDHKIVLKNGIVLRLNGSSVSFQDFSYGEIHHDIIHIPEKHSYVLTLMSGKEHNDILKIKDNLSLSYYKRDSMESVMPRKIFTPEEFSRRASDFHHLNALAYNKCNNLLALSFRTLNTVAFVDYDTLKLKYLLADKRSISPNYHKYLLKNTGDNKDINSGQHAVQFINCHQLILFNNGISRHLRNPKTKNYSSIDLYDIDFKNHSFKLSKQWKSKTFSKVVSYVDYDPRTEQFFMSEGSTPHVQILRMLDKNLKKVVWNLKITKPASEKNDYFIRSYRSFPFNLN